jgi:hypothetical protein
MLYAFVSLYPERIFIWRKYTTISNKKSLLGILFLVFLFRLLSFVGMSSKKKYRNDGTSLHARRKDVPSKMGKVYIYL